jgi:hypothetical protein
MARKIKMACMLDLPECKNAKNGATVTVLLQLVDFLENWCYNVF